VVACARARSSQVFLVLCGAQVAMPTTRTFNADGFTYEALLSRASFLPLSVLLAALGSIASARENIQVAKQLGMHMVLPGDEDAFFRDWNRVLMVEKHIKLGLTELQAYDGPITRNPRIGLWKVRREREKPAARARPAAWRAGCGARPLTDRKECFSQTMSLR
jgi:hypothetical protein